MALTWRNVDAPNFNGAGALFESAQNSFNNSLGILQAAADRAAAQRKAAASAQMLSGLAGVQRGGVADYLATQDATMLTPEALQIALGQEDVLAGRAAKEVELQNAQGDLAWETGTRQGDLLSRAARAQAQQALSQGDFGRANTIMDGLSGFALDDAAMTFGRDVDEQTFQNDIRSNVSDLIKNNDSIDAARIKVMNGNYSERERAALNNQLNSMSDADFNRIDPDLPDVFSGSETDTFNKNQTQVVQQDIQSRLASSPTHQYDMHLKNLTVNPEGTPEGDSSGSGGKTGGYADPVKYLGEQMGMDTSAGVFRTGMARNIQTAKAKANERLKDKGLQVSDWEIAAAIASTRETGRHLVPFTGGTDQYYVDEDAAVEMAVRMKDPDSRKEDLKHDLFYTGYADKLADAANKIQKARNSYNIAVTKNSSNKEERYNKAIEAEEAYRKLLEQYYEDNQSNNANSGAQASPATPAGAASAAAAPMVMQGPAIPNDLIREAMIRDAAIKAEAQRRNNQKPVSVVLPNGVIAQEYPSILGDGSTLREINW